MIGDTEQSYGITYKDISGLLDTYTTPHNAFTYSYDKFDSLKGKSGSKHYIAYTYVNGSQRVATYTVSQADYSSLTYAYTYDNLGNITSVKKNGTTVSVYEYDKLGRLIREDDCASNVCWVYTYDNAGNLLNKYEFPGTGPNVAHWMGTYPSIGELVSTYTYSTSDWGDLLTNYNGTTITYDAIGNPLKWRNAASMTWDKRALQSMTLSDGTAVSFQYNADGIRTQKTVGSTTHSYVLDGTNIQSETVTGASNYTLYYIYDVSGSVIGFHHNNGLYYFQKNLQGDVIRILNTTGTIVTEYKYDAWGNILSITGTQADTIGQYNPFRYRGYYYDAETGFYYLNSRYYDPQVGRFLNADGIIGANGDIMGYNMFAYCSNNPVMYVDVSGEFVISISILGIAKVVAVAVVLWGAGKVVEKHVENRVQQKSTEEILDQILEKTLNEHEKKLKGKINKVSKWAKYVQVVPNFAQALRAETPDFNTKTAIVLNLLLYGVGATNKIYDFGIGNYSTYCNMFKKDAVVLLGLRNPMDKITYQEILDIVDNWNSHVWNIQYYKNYESLVKSYGVIVDFLVEVFEDTTNIPIR